MKICIELTLSQFAAYFHAPDRVADPPKDNRKISRGKQRGIKRRNEQKHCVDTHLFIANWFKLILMCGGSPELRDILLLDISYTNYL